MEKIYKKNLGYLSPHLDTPGPKVNWKFRELIVQYSCSDNKNNKVCLSILFDMKDWCKFINLVTFLQDRRFLSYYIVKVLGAQSCPTLCNPMDCSLPGYSVHGILQARILEWVVILFARGSSWPRDQTRVSHIAGRFLTVWATREAIILLMIKCSLVARK